MKLNIRLFSNLYVQTNFSSVICVLCVMKKCYDNIRELNCYRNHVYLSSESNNFIKKTRRFICIQCILYIY